MTWLIFVGQPRNVASLTQIRLAGSSAFAYKFIYRSDLILAEEGVDICLDILNEVVDKAAATILDHYLEREIFPFSVREAKKSILKIIAVSKLRG